MLFPCSWRREQDGRHRRWGRRWPMLYSIQIHRNLRWTAVSGRATSTFSYIIILCLIITQKLSYFCNKVDRGELLAISEIGTRSDENLLVEKQFFSSVVVCQLVHNPYSHPKGYHPHILIGPCVVRSIVFFSWVEMDWQEMTLQNCIVDTSRYAMLSINT